MDSFRRSLCLGASVIGLTRWASAQSVAGAAAVRSDPGLLAQPLGEVHRLALGHQDPNVAAGFALDFGAKAVALEEMTGAWRLGSTRIAFASGGSDLTARLHLRPHASPQRWNWRNQAGWLSDPRDFRDFDFTVFFRLTGRVSRERAQVAFKLRGGHHSGKSPDDASCSFITFAPADRKQTSRFGKELTHPVYDYVPLVSRRTQGLEEGLWLGAKVMSWRGGQGVVTQLWIARNPFAHGIPRSVDWELHSEYLDAPGARTGHYDQMVDWGGWQTTFRVDGFEVVDFRWPSLTALAYPLSPQAGFESRFL
jgi:hypothetical protein